MQKKLTITLDEGVYEGLRNLAGDRESAVLSKRWFSRAGAKRP